MLAFVSATPGRGYRGSRGPSGLRATASLAGNDRSADGSNKLPRTADDPSVPLPNDSDARSESSSRRPTRIQDPASHCALHNAAAAAHYRYKFQT